MKNSFKYRYVRVRVLTTPTKSGYPIVLDYSNGVNDRYKLRTGIFLKDVPEVFEGQFKRQHSPDYKNLQTILDKKLEEMNQVISDFEDTYGRRPNKDELIKWLKKPFSQPQKRLCYLPDCFSTVYEYKVKSLTNIKSADNYKSLAFAITDFSNRSNKSFSIDDINEDFLESFILYLLFYKPVNEKVSKATLPKHKLIDGNNTSVFDKKYGMCNNTLKKRMYTFVTILKTYSAITDTSINLNRIRLDIELILRKLGIVEYRYQKPTITYNEFEQLISDEFTEVIHRDTTPGREKGKVVTKYISRDKILKVRDTFILSVTGGSRFSDVISTSPRNIEEGVKISQKTGAEYNVVTNSYIKSLYEKHDYNLKICNHRYNTILKLLFIQFRNFLKNKISNYQTQYFWKIEKRGKYTMEHKYCKWEMLSSHAGRRSFATMARMEFDITKEEVRKITGHASDKMLDTYIQVNQDKGYQKINQIMNFNNE